MTDVRIRLDIAYDGSDFHGWARQPQLRSVQGVLEDALAAVVRHRVQLTVAGRTDAGVHARGQVAHFDLPAANYLALRGHHDRDPHEALVAKLAGYLARGSGVRRHSDIVVYSARRVPPDFDARFSALARHYRYRIADMHAPFDPRTRHFTWWVYRHMELAQMRAAGAVLLGEWDFAALCKPRAKRAPTESSTIRRLTQVDVTRDAEGVIAIDVSADAFCHSMVRSIVGCLVAVGTQRRPVPWMEEVLMSRDRSKAAAVAPAHGLTLMGVDYPEAEAYGTQAARARRVRTRARGRD
ncbi:MAG: tRNA pseudouridine(38-40) synthase TruA [Bowdeniella nasicola]|nr:tRNA pseudouridine(38-40) synthase TruA [Bowdeniella nasicola]